MIVKEGREYIVNNGITKSLSKIKVYFDNDQNITTEDRTFDVSSFPLIFPENSTNPLTIDSTNPLDIKFTISNVKKTNLISTGDSISISSLMLVIKDDGKNILLSRVVFPTRTLIGDTIALNFEYHLYF